MPGRSGLAFPVEAAIAYHTNRGRLRTRLASWPLRRLPAELGASRPPLLVPANALRAAPRLSLVTADEARKPASRGFLLSGQCENEDFSCVASRGLCHHRASALKARESFRGHKTLPRTHFSPTFLAKGGCKGRRGLPRTATPKRRARALPPWVPALPTSVRGWRPVRSSFANGRYPS
jgi:hypothetical protein